MPSSLRGHYVFVRSDSSFDPIISQLLPGVSFDLDTYRVSFDLVFQAQMGTADWALSLTELPVQNVFRVTRNMCVKGSFSRIDLPVPSDAPRYK